LTLILVACSKTTFTVTFDVDGEGSESIEVEKNSLVTRPADPVKTGYDFIDWYEDADKTKTWDFASKKVGENVTIYAKFEIKKFNVTFDTDDGTPVDGQLIEYNSLVCEPSKPTKEGYDFVGWFKDAAKTIPWNFQTDEITANTIIYAKWSLKEGLFPKGGLREQIDENNPRILNKVYVSTKSALQSKAKGLEPGTAVIIEDGTYDGVVLSPEANGTKENPIFYIAKNPGKVKFTGEARIEIKGNYNIISGIEFTNGSPKYDSGIIVIRGSYNRINNIKVTNFNGSFTKSNWITLKGQYNVLDNSTFSGKSHKGPLLNIMREDDSPNYHYIHHNHFLDFASGLEENEWETIRIGTSVTSRSSSFTVVENNLFERTNGEIEVISVKAGENLIKGNTFIEVEGLVTLRHGIKNIVEDNVFLTNSITDGGGIRFFDGEHIIRNNYIEGVRTSASFRGGIIIHSGNNSIGKTTSKSGQWTAFNTLIENNTLIDCERSFVYEGKYPHAPENITFRNNLVFAENKEVVFEGITLVNPIYDNEHYCGASLGIELKDGIFFSQEAPILSTVNGLKLHSEFGARDLNVLNNKNAGCLF